MWKSNNMRTKVKDEIKHQFDYVKLIKVWKKDSE